MTDLEQLRLQRDALSMQIAVAESNETLGRARDAFTRLASDNLPVLEILDQALHGWASADPTRQRLDAREFVARLSAIVDVYPSPSAQRG